MRLRRLLVSALVGAALPVSLFVGTGVVLAVSFTHADVAHSHRDTRHLQYGFPLAWFTQDQSALSPPPYPQRLAAAKPQEFPTTWRFTVLAADIGITAGTIAIAMLAAAGVLEWLNRRSRRRPNNVMQVTAAT